MQTDSVPVLTDIREPVTMRPWSEQLAPFPVFPMRTDVDFEQPHQHTIVEDYVRDWQPIIAGFDNATVDRLINVIESIKLRRAIERRAELETLMQRTRGDLAQLSNEWEKVQVGIVQMVARGVER